MQAITRVLSDGRVLAVAVERRGQMLEPVVTIDGTEQSTRGHIEKFQPQAVGGKTYTHGIILRASGVIALTADEVAAYDAAYRRVIDAETLDEHNRMLAAIPGIQELRAAREAEERYSAAFTRMMEDSLNDGANPPKRPSVSADDVATKYPLAALYLRAESYADSDHPVKRTAGCKAKAILLDGGSESEAKRLLDSWLDGVYID